MKSGRFPNLGQEHLPSSRLPVSWRPWADAAWPCPGTGIQPVLFGSGKGLVLCARVCLPSLDVLVQGRA